MLKDEKTSSAKILVLRQLAMVGLIVLWVVVILLKPSLPVWGQYLALIALGLLTVGTLFLTTKSLITLARKENENNTHETK